MWKWLLRQAIKTLAEPIVDSVIELLETLARKTNNTLDDALVEKLKEFRSMIIAYLVGQADNISKRAK